MSNQGRVGGRGLDLSYSEADSRLPACPTCPGAQQVRQSANLCTLLGKRERTEYAYDLQGYKVFKKDAVDADCKELQFAELFVRAFPGQQGSTLQQEIYN